MTMTEAELQASVIQAAKLLGLAVYHTRNSIGSEPGWPDLTIVGGKRVLFRELKSDGGRVTPEQKFWIKALEKSGMDANVWRPSQWPLEILSELRALGRVEIERPAPTVAQLRRRATRRSQRPSR